VQTDTLSIHFHIKIVSTTITIRVGRRKERAAVKRLVHVANQMNEEGKVCRAQFLIGVGVAQNFFTLHYSKQHVVGRSLVGFKEKFGRTQWVINEMPFGMIIRTAASPDFVRPHAGAHEYISGLADRRIGMV